MPRFFCENITPSQAIISGDDAKHIAKVLRMRVGDAVTLCDMQGTDYYCKIAILGEQIELNVIKSYKNETEPSVKITLFQCLPKADKLEFIIKKAVELGVYRIVPVMSEFCTAKLTGDEFEKKRERYQKIAYEAAKQSGRGLVPTVEPLVPIKSAFEQAKNETAVIFYEGGGEKIKEILHGDEKEISLFVGSEGGFSQKEVESAKENGIARSTLGRLILRCETAPIVGMTLVLHEFDIM